MKAVMDDVEEGRLVELAGSGDRDASSELVRRYRDRIYRTIQRFTRNQSDADDLFQETFLRAFRDLPTFGRRSKFYTWVYRIAVNQCLNFLKKKGKEMGGGEWADQGPDDRRPAAGSPESSAAAEELRDRLAAAIDSLPLPYRTCFTLVVFQGMTHRQAAGVLGCREKTVSWRMHKARKMLQAKLRPNLGEVSDEM
jgi:RNA polymerase sigma-70 factor (ECF subfamily)